MRRRKKAIDADLRRLRAGLPTGDHFSGLTTFAFHTLGRPGGPPRRQLDAAFAALATAAAALDPELRRGALYALSHWYERRACRLLLRVMDTEQELPVIRGQAAEGVANTVPASPDKGPHRSLVSAALGRALVSPEPEVRFWAVFAVGTADFREHRPRIEAMAKEDQGVCPHMWRVCLEAEDVLAAWDGGVWPCRVPGTGEIAP